MPRTINEFATELGITQTVLLEKLTQSGIMREKHDVISDEDKATLIAFLESSNKVQPKKLSLAKKKPTTDATASEPEATTTTKTLDSGKVTVAIKRKKVLVRDVVSTAVPEITPQELKLEDAPVITAPAAAIGPADGAPE